MGQEASAPVDGAPHESTYGDGDDASQVPLTPAQRAAEGQRRQAAAETLAWNAAVESGRADVFTDHALLLVTFGQTGALSPFYLHESSLRLELRAVCKSLADHCEAAYVSTDGNEFAALFVDPRAALAAAAQVVPAVSAYNARVNEACALPVGGVAVTFCEEIFVDVTANRLCGHGLDGARYLVALGATNDQQQAAGSGDDNNDNTTAPVARISMV